MGVFLSLFSDLGFASVVKGSPDPSKVQEDRKTLKNGPQKGHHFHKNSEFFVMLFSLVFGKSWEVFFCALVAEMPQMGLLGNTFPGMLQQSWKAEN